VFWLRTPVRVAVERGPATWALTAADHRRGPEIPPDLRAASLIDATADAAAIEPQLRAARLGARLPSGAAAIVWPWAGDAAASDLDARPKPAAPLPKANVLRHRLAPFVRAGGRVRALVWPHGAAADVAASHGWCSACLAVLHDGAACLVTIDDVGTQARYLSWARAAAPSDEHARLLQRFQLASRLAPHLRDWLTEHPAAVVAVCGALPDLRSRMVPLVEELDREIEVLDAGLPGAAGEVPEAAALQLAWAVATRRG
jgi:hypothetical protein